MAFTFQTVGLPAAVIAQIGEYAKFPDSQRRGATRDCAEWFHAEDPPLPFTDRIQIVRFDYGERDVSWLASGPDEYLGAFHHRYTLDCPGLGRPKIA